MKQLPYPSSLITRVVGAVVAATVLVVGLTLGFALFLVILGLGAIALAAFFARFYWLRRKFMRRMREREQVQHPPPGQERHYIIEGEYEVERSARDRR
jgi:hypothetical protein